MIISLGGFLFGYDLNVMIGGIIFLRRHFHMQPMALGFAVSGATLGCGAGALAGGYICGLAWSKEDPGDNGCDFRVREHRHGGTSDDFPV